MEGDPPARATPHPQTAMTDRRSSVVLIADRDQGVRKLQRHFLKKAGFDVEFVDDGEAAYERVLALRPHLVVTEILLPKLDGLALCRRIREDPVTRDIPVMVFSMLAAGGRARDAGATVFLRKPFVDSIFVAAVQELTASQPIANLERA